MTGVLYRIAQFCVRRKLIVLAVWLVAAVALVAISKQMGDNTNDNLSLPGTNSQRATDVLKKSFPTQANGTSPIILHATSGKLTDSKYSRRDQPGRRGRRQAARCGLRDQSAHAAGRRGAEQGPGDRLPDVGLKVSPGSLSEEEAQTIVNAAADPAKAAGLEVQTGGQLGQKVSKPGPSPPS